MDRIIFHIDVNSAFLSWTAVEQLKHGADHDIREIPTIIGGEQKSRQGVVLAKSISAKKAGVVTGEPVVNALRKCQELEIYPPDHAMYNTYSHELMKFLMNYTPDIEQISVDECFMDFIIEIRTIVMIFVLIIVSVCIYQFLPNKRGKVKYQIPGAIFTAFGWTFASFLFYIYEHI